MNRLALIPLVALLALDGCAALKRDAVGVTENNLTVAGFNALPVSTPERQKMMATLPPDHVSQRFEGDHVSYLYPDPIICNCLYVGSQAAWGRYLAAAQARNTPVVQFQVVQLSPDFGWDWGPWGGYGPGFY
jgi:hypothetical protein